MAYGQVASEGSFSRLAAFNFVTDALAFDQVQDFFGQVFGVVSGSFKRLGHQEEIRAVVTRSSIGAFQMTAKHVPASLIDLRVGLQHPIRRLDIAIDKSLMNALEHGL
jgi:hypothetical protein